MAKSPTTKLCTTCGLVRPTKEFATNRSRPDGLQNQCRACKKVYNAQYYPLTKDRYREQRSLNRKQMLALNMTRILMYLGTHPCVDCGETDPVVLDFDHVTGTKQANISTMKSFSWQRIQAEIDKCEVRCANCHRRRTARQQGWYRATGICFPEELTTSLRSSEEEHSPLKGRAGISKFSGGT